MPITLRSLSHLFNYAEVAIWPALGFILGGYALRQRGAVRRDCLLAAGTLVIFGASDYFEANTNNEWWRPWWLFLWKAACVVTLLVLLMVSFRRQRASRRSAQIEDTR